MNPIINHLIGLSKKLGLDTQDITKNSISIWTKITGIKLGIRVINKNRFEFYYLVRTSSFLYDGERSDLHDVYSIIFGIFLKNLKICCAEFILLPHPIAHLDNEIYGIFIIPKQIDLNLVTIDPFNHDKLDKFVCALPVFEALLWKCFNGCPCDDCRSNLKIYFKYRWGEIDSNILNLVSTLFGNSENINYCERTLPTWFYYRDFSKGISFIKSIELANFVGSLQFTPHVIDGVNGEILLENHFNNFLDYRTKRYIFKYFRRLKNK